MRTETLDASVLIDGLRRDKIAMIAELKSALGTEVDVTVFRKLKQIAYRTSYSHRGAYYALDETIRFDANGLWSFRSIWFSIRGTLLDTAEALVGNAQAGYYVEELDRVLHVGTQEPLLRLVQQKRVTRQLVEGLFLYCCVDPVRRERPLMSRHLLQSAPGLASGLAAQEVVPGELKAAIVLFFSTLDEKQRRLYAGLESLKLGYGGDQRIADFINMSPHTVAKGRRELMEQDLNAGRIRNAGAGRRRVEKKHPKSPPASQN